ncbi:MAG: molybdopterin molybdotransferase [Paracoccaceae bacterium]|jgi:molybdopterin molybdotransferase
MITVSQARALLFDLIAPMPGEQVPLSQAAGRVLCEDAVAQRDQPPFAAASMDGYAMNAAEVEQHALFKVIGEAAAGRRFAGRVGAGQAVRIFTGAPVPDGADFVVIQEDISRKGDLITIIEHPSPKDNIRPLGIDFRAGTTVSAPRLLHAKDVALLAAMNIPRVSVTRKPVIALISNGDELVMPGETPGPDQIIVSNTFGLKALLEGIGADVRMLPIARDSVSSLTTAFDLAKGADLVVTIGGASVGDHDLVERVAAELGLDRSFYKVLMRPGKPLMAGRLGNAAMVGLPGNPVSAMVCGYIFIAPMVLAMLGLGTDVPPLRSAPLAHGLTANGPRAHYMRGQLENGQITVFDDQDSSLLTVLAQANVLVVRPAKDHARQAGADVDYLAI